MSCARSWYYLLRVGTTCLYCFIQLMYFHSRFWQKLALSLHIGDIVSILFHSAHVFSLQISLSCFLTWEKLPNQIMIVRYMHAQCKLHQECCMMTEAVKKVERKRCKSKGCFRARSLNDPKILSICYTMYKYFP